MTESQKKEIRELKGKNFTGVFVEEFEKQWDEVVFLLKNGRKKHE